MNRLLLSLVIVISSGAAFSAPPDSLKLATWKEYIDFGSYLPKNERFTMNFIVENQEEKRLVRCWGTLYSDKDTIYLKLFYSFKEKDSVLSTFDRIAISGGSEKRSIAHFFRKTLRYKSVLCYEHHIRKNPYSNDLPEISNEHYWNYRFQYKKNKKYVSVRRDKLSLKDKSGCNTIRNMKKERRDFEVFRKTINIVLAQNRYPLL